MNPSFKVLFSLVLLPLLMLLNGCNSGGASSKPTVTLERIDIAASPIKTRGANQLTLAAGNEQPFEAVGYYSDGTSHILTDLSVSDWHTSDKDVGLFNTAGTLTGGETPGLVTVYAMKDGITSNSVNVNVTAAVLTSIAITPSDVKVARGQTQQLTAMATYSDNTYFDVTTSVTWTPSDKTTVTVTPDGLLLGEKSGKTTLTATKDGTSSKTVTVNVTTAVLTSIAVSPSSVKVAKDQTVQLTAVATYSDNSSFDATNAVTWTSNDETIATVASGLLSGENAGVTTLTATKDNITSNRVDVNVCDDLAGTCIAFFDTGAGKLFTNSPSVAYLDSIGGSATNGILPEDGTSGPTGDFYQFDLENANALCETYSNQNIGGRNNWHLATKDELEQELYGQFPNMSTLRGWPTGDRYRSSTIKPNTSVYYNVRLNNGEINATMPSVLYYVSCVSNP